jgi:pyrroloquinoline quinone biosynthesis protein B
MRYIYLFCTLYILACKPAIRKNSGESSTPNSIDSALKSVSLIVLGTVQDAGSPHIACSKACCRDLFVKPDQGRKVVSLGIMDPQSRKNFLFEASPDLPMQMKLLNNYSSFTDKETPDGIFLTHAHIGHYSGLMYLGREAMNADSVTVYVMPGMRRFLESNGPWSQLVNLGNIALLSLSSNNAIQLTPQVRVTPFLVPHRDEYSETAGYIIEGPNKKALFIPDIDKWEKWDRDLISTIAWVDYAFIDATFYDGEEINNRDISEIPHPFVIETMEKLAGLPATEKAKIHFIHFNHTNPLLDPQSPQTRMVLDRGFKIARMQMVLEL